MNAPAVKLSFYISRRFTTTILAVFLGCAVLIFLIDFVEVLRKASTVEDVGIGTLLLISLYKVPSLSEQVLPFAVLFGAIAAFLSLSRKSELVVARSAGMSAWQIIVPGVLVAFVIGVAAVTAFNPLSAFLKEEQGRLEASYLGRGGDRLLATSGEGIWLRQEGIDGQSVMHSARVRQNGEILDEVTAFVFDADKRFAERIEARSATLKVGYWDLKEAWVIRPNVEPTFYQAYSISTYLSPTQIRDSIADPEKVSFWGLPAFIAVAERAGLPATAFRLQYQILLARPLFLSAMVIIAATVSMRVFRFGNIGRMIVSGVAAGFALYVATKILADLGENDILPAFLAGWLPGIIGILAGLSVLLYQEDG
jgi:lipopolysaccharide export system permease protein